MKLSVEINMYRLVAIARGEQEYFDPSNIATATEACKSNALMRCCKDLGIASELWCVVMVIMEGCQSYHSNLSGTLGLSVNSKQATVWKFSPNTFQLRRSQFLLLSVQ
jgi:hypothetical protein